MLAKLPFQWDKREKNSLSKETKSPFEASVSFYSRDNGLETEGKPLIGRFCHEWTVIPDQENESKTISNLLV